MEAYFANSGHWLSWFFLTGSFLLPPTRLSLGLGHNWNGLQLEAGIGEKKITVELKLPDPTATFLSLQGAYAVGQYSSSHFCEHIRAGNLFHGCRCCTGLVHTLRKSFFLRISRNTASQTSVCMRVPRDLVKTQIPSLGLGWDRRFQCPVSPGCRQAPTQLLPSALENMGGIMS